MIHKQCLELVKDLFQCKKKFPIILLQKHAAAIKAQHETLDGG
jgi:hypothetical protein